MLGVRIPYLRNRVKSADIKSVLTHPQNIPKIPALVTLLSPYIGNPYSRARLPWERKVVGKKKRTKLATTSGIT